MNKATPCIIAIVNSKGGTAKTTTAIHLSDALVRQGRRVLIVDLDEQGNLTKHALLRRIGRPPGDSANWPQETFDAEHSERERLRAAHNIVRIARGETLLPDSVTPTEIGDLVASHADIPDLVREVASDPRLPARILTAIESAPYDTVLIDTPGRAAFELTLASTLAHVLIMTVMPADWSIETLPVIEKAFDAAGRDKTRRFLFAPVVFAEKSNHAEFLQQLAELAKSRGRIVLPAIPRDENVQLRTEAGLALSPKSHAFLRFREMAETIQEVQVA